MSCDDVGLVLDERAVLNCFSWKNECTCMELTSTGEVCIKT